MVARRFWTLGPAKPNTASTSIGVHVSEGRDEGDPIEAEGAMGVETSCEGEAICTLGTNGSEPLSSSEWTGSSSIGGTSLIPEVDGLLWGGSIGSTNVDFDEAEGFRLAGGLGGAVDEEAGSSDFFFVG